MCQVLYIPLYWVLDLPTSSIVKLWRPRTNKVLHDSEADPRAAPDTSRPADLAGLAALNTTMFAEPSMAIMLRRT